MSFSGLRTASPCGDLFGWFHLQRIIEPVEIVEESNCCQQFDHFAFVKMFTQVAPELVGDDVCVPRDLLSQAKSGLLAISEIAAVFEIVEVVDLVVCPAQPSCQDGMRGQSIFATIDLRSAGYHQFFELG